MNELENLTHIIMAIFSNDNQARIEAETLLKKIREEDFNRYIFVFCNLLNGNKLTSFVS